MENGIIAYLILVGTFLFGVYILFTFAPIILWVKAIKSGIGITLLDLIDMKVRRVPPAPIVRSMIIAVKAGIDLQREALEAHGMAGGNVVHVVELLIMAKKKKAPLSFKAACEQDLAKIPASS